MKFRDFGLKLSPQNQLDNYFLTVRQYWLDIANHKTSLETLPLNSYEI